MNPYSPSASKNETARVARIFIPCFAFAAYLAYVTFMMLNRGAYNTLSGLSVIEACVVLGIASVTGLIVAFPLKPHISKTVMLASRSLGGVTFGVGFVVCQPLVLPFSWYLITPITRVPIIGEIAQRFVALISRNYPLIQLQKPQET